MMLHSIQEQNAAPEEDTKGITSDAQRFRVLTRAAYRRQGVSRELGSEAHMARTKENGGSTKEAPRRRRRQGQ